MNFGSIVGPILFGFSGVAFGCHFAFIASGLGMLVAAFLYCLHYRYFSQNSEGPSTKTISLLKQMLAVPALLLIVFLFFVIFEFPHLFSYITECLAVMLVVVFSFLLNKSSIQERRGILVFIAFCFFTIIASAGEMQTGSSMLVFIQLQIDHQIMGHKIPPSFFASLEPMAVIGLAFFFSTLLKYPGYKKHSISPPYMVALGVLLTGLSFLLLSLSASASKINGFNVPLYLLVLANIVMGAGELCAIPIVMSTIEFLAPKHLKAFFMGIFFMAFAFSGYFAGLMAMTGDSLLHSATLKLTNTVYYRDFFGIIGLIIIFGSLWAFLLAPRLKRMMHAHLMR
jgi:POT family proton-dependent oligopeptide transporter